MMNRSSLYLHRGGGGVGRGGEGRGGEGRGGEGRGGEGRGGRGGEGRGGEGVDYCDGNAWSSPPLLPHLLECIPQL